MRERHVARDDPLVHPRIECRQKCSKKTRQEADVAESSKRNIATPVSSRPVKRKRNSSHDPKDVLQSPDEAGLYWRGDLGGWQDGRPFRSAVGRVTAECERGRAGTIRDVVHSNRQRRIVESRCRGRYVGKDLAEGKQQSDREHRAGQETRTERRSKLSTRRGARISTELASCTEDDRSDGPTGMGYGCVAPGRHRTTRVKLRSSRNSCAARSAMATATSTARSCLGDSCRGTYAPSCTIAPTTRSHDIEPVRVRGGRSGGR